jgi:NitT/TauT family transport system substrate-binding protein
LGGQGKVLATSLNLLVIADILVLNRGFAEQHPEWVKVLVAGLLTGNRQVQENPDSCLDVMGRAFGWDRAKIKAELAGVHLSNLPENQGFFSGWLDSGGTFADIYQSTVRAYGNELVSDSVGYDRFIEARPLAVLEHSGAFNGQEAAIVPLHSGDSALPPAPLLSQDIRFLFKPNTFTLQLNQKANEESLAAIKRMLQVSPGSTVLLRGHVDNGRLEEIRKMGGDNYVRLMAERAKELSKDRALEIRRLLVEQYDVNPGRIDTVGLGWDEPVGTSNELNRRVEAQWFTIR